MALSNTEQLNRISVQRALRKIYQFLLLCNKLHKNLEAHNKLQDADYLIWACSLLCKGLCCSQCLTGAIQWEEVCPICSSSSSRTSRIDMASPHGDGRCAKANKASLPSGFQDITYVTHIILSPSMSHVWA